MNNSAVLSETEQPSMFFFLILLFDFNFFKIDLLAYSKV